MNLAHREPGRARRHDVGVIAEDAQRTRLDRARRGLVAVNDGARAHLTVQC